MSKGSSRSITRYLFVLLVVLLLSTAAAGQSANSSVTVVDTVELSEDLRITWNLAWDGTNLWHVGVANSSGVRIREVDPSTGSILDFVELQQSSNIDGLAATEDSLWVLTSPQSDTQEILQIDPDTGNRQKTIPVPTESQGLAYNNGSLWTIGTSNGRFFEIDADTGNVTKKMQMSSSSSSVYSVESLSWAEGFLWVGGSSSIKQFDTTGSTAVLTNDRSLSSAPYGLAWDGEYFWIGYYENTTINRIDIGEIGSPNSPPDVQLRYTPSNPTAGQSVSFDASSSTDPEGYITQYEWDFDGDGISDAQGENTSRVFEEPGQYHVNLRIHDNTGGINQTNRSITIDPPAITTVQEATTVKQRQRDDTLVTTVASSGSSVSPSEPPAQSANDRSQTSSQGNVGKEQTGTNDAAGKLSLLEIGASIATITVALAGGTRWVYRRIKK